jgi:CRP/FNR family transcriptional regulator, cyclic AMP receptor protein
MELSLETVIGFLGTTPVFRGLDAAERGEVIRIMEMQHLADAQMVCREGDAGDAWFVIYEGCADVLKDASSGPVLIAQLDTGACFGEMALLDDAPRSASVRANGPLTLFRFRRANFEELLEQGSLAAFKLVAGMARILCQRHRDLMRRTTEHAPSAEIDGTITP